MQNLLLKVKVGGTHIYCYGRWYGKSKDMRRGSRNTRKRAVDKPAEKYEADEIEEEKQYDEEA